MLKIYLILFIGVLIVSSSSIIIRWTGDVPATVIAFYRVFISFCILLLYRVAIRRDVRALTKNWHWHYSLAGLFLAGHFICWIGSLQSTTIANAIFLESIHPLFGIIVSIIFLKEYPQKNIFPIVLIALLGMGIIMSHDIGKPGTHLSGDILALFSAFFFSLYIMIARKHRRELDFIKYLIYVYGTAAILCACYITFSSVSFSGYSSKSWLFMILLALGPNLLGHSTLNWSSRHLEIFKVNLVILFEPILATLSGMIFLTEYPPSNFYPGAFLILSALGYLIWNEQHDLGKKFAKK
jgi:drug/metabolite transporter (DMT)-like permease